MIKNLNLRTLGLSTAIVLATSAFAAHAATMPTTIDPVPGNANAAEVSTSLNQMGFTEVQNVAHSGDVYSTKAKWDGKWVDLTIDAKTGAIMQHNEMDNVIALPASATDQQIRDELTRLGYSGIAAVERSGNVITTKAFKGGEQHALTIDTKTGAVTEAKTNDAIRMPKQNLTTTELRDQLSPLGYNDVRDVEEQGNVYTLSAYKDGAWTRLQVDAKNGAVTVIE
ncbi:MAG: PepSY domain-containing protein [Alphaproteobacteria bacterium]